MLWQRNDAALVREVLGGRHEQFGLLVERHLPRVLAIAGARVRNRADADDAAQEAFLKAYTSLDTLKDHARFAPWLTAIVRNVCATFQRARREESLELTPAHEPAVEPEHETRELHAVLRREIDRLEPDAREVLLLHYFAGLKIREMAETLSISPAAAGKRLDRARDALGQQLITQLGPALDLYKPREGQAKRLSAVVLAVRPAWPTVPVTAAAVATSFTGITILKALIAGAALVAVTGMAAWQLEKPAAPSQPVSVAPAPPAKEAAPPPPTAKITEAPAQPGEPQISGRVYDAATGAGIPGVKVAAEMPGQPRAESAPTDKNGYYAFDTLPEGRWMLQRGEARSYPFGKEIEKVAVNAAPARKITGVDFALRKGVLIRGHVLDPSGATVPKAHVHDGASRGTDIVRSDAEGRFELWIPEPGIAALRAYTAGGDVESVTRRGITQTVPLQGLDGVELILHPYGKISGIVKNSAGRPVPSVSVNACVKESDGYKSFPSDSAVTDEKGAFEIARLFEGAYMLKVAETNVQEITLGSGQHLKDVALIADLPEPSTPVPGQGTMTISGRILDPIGKPLQGAYVMVSGEDESNRWSHGSQMTSDDGAYKITGLLPGLHEVWAMCPPYSEAKRSAVASGSGGVELKLVEEPVLKGRVLRADSGEPITDFAICPTGRSEPMFKGSDITADALPASSGLHFHDPAGAFTLKDTEITMGRGSPLLVVQAEGFATQAVPIAPNATESGVETVVRLVPEARIEGIVVDSRGQPVPQAFIIPGRPLDISPEKLATFARACTDTEGRFVIGGLPRLDLTLSANHPKHPQAIGQ
ncbi:MAG: sigma-70 family RNA polymerase sigma factor, partial [FCB group bacterium]|nr:sigma-70 family RNA polymerase sigma factor [FCB group bacterium]